MTPEQIEELRALRETVPPRCEFFADGAMLAIRFAESGYDAGCCGQPLPSGECCGNAVPVPVEHERCEAIAEGDPATMRYLAAAANSVDALLSVADQVICTQGSGATPMPSRERLLELLSEIERRREIALEKIGPLLMDEIEPLIRLALRETERR